MSCSLTSRSLVMNDMHVFMSGVCGPPRLTGEQLSGVSRRGLQCKGRQRGYRLSFPQCKI